MRSISRCLLALALGLTACSRQMLGGEGTCTGSACADGGGSPDGNGGGPDGSGSGPDLGPGMSPDRSERAGPGGAAAFDPAGNGSMGVRLDAEGNIILTSGIVGTSQKLIWIANSGEGTISKIDTTQMKEVARYYTYPGGGGDPSRSTVGLSGDVVVANRAKIFTARASAIRIAADERDCIDRNGNKKIDTFKGSGPVPAEYAWLTGDKSPDECVLWLTDLSLPGKATLPRAAGFDFSVPSESKVYIGLHGTSELLRLDGKTGAIEKRISVAPATPYGLVIDKDGNVWVLGRDDAGLAISLIRVNVRMGDQLKVYDAASGKAPPCPYGIATDSRGFIYTSGGKNPDTCVSRFDPVRETWEVLKLGAPPGSMAGALTFARGLAIDQDDHVWIADTYQGMFHVDASGARMVHLGTVLLPGATSIGAAIDFDHRPWVVSQERSRAYRVDPKTLATQGVDVGQAPYTYSDMTGYQLRNVAPSHSGVYRHVFAGCKPGQGTSGTRWRSLDYSAQVPAGTGLTLRLRHGRDRAALASASFMDLVGPPPIPLGITGSELVEVEFTLTTTHISLTPVLRSITVSYSCPVTILG